MSGFGAVKERTYELIETGEYVFTLNDLEAESGGPYGDSMKWDWLLAPKDDPTSYLARRDGMERTVRVWTDADIIIGSQCHEWIQVLTGQPFEAGDEPPEFDDLVGKRMVAYLTHQAPKRGPKAGQMREKIVAGSAKPFALPGSKRNGKAATQVSADPSSDDVDRALVVTNLEKQVAKLERLNATRGAEARAAMASSDLDAAPLAELEALLEQIKAAVSAELDD